MEDWKKVNGQVIRITSHTNVTALLYADDKGFVNETEDDLQRATHGKKMTQNMLGYDCINFQDKIYVNEREGIITIKYCNTWSNY
jgi:hypothetical protein